MRPPLLAALLAEHVNVIRLRIDEQGGQTDEEVSPPASTLAAVLARQSWTGLPVLRRIISTPVLRPDGTLLQTPGYDPATGFFLAASRPIDPVPERPSPAEVAASREFLLERFLHAFPWRSPADRANYLAMLVSPIIRRPYTRCLSPFGVIDATMPGSGRTILAGCVGLLVGQRVLTWTDSDDDLRKSITTVLADSVGVVVFDNLIEGAVIDSAVLARLVTERTWTDRKLGTNTASTYANDRLWLATGNNLRTGGDMASRAVWVRLDPNCPRPEARTGFTIPNLESWILQSSNEATVLRHVLTLILDWTAHGAPTSSRVPEMRQFTRWAQHLGGFLETTRSPDSSPTPRALAGWTTTPRNGGRSCCAGTPSTATAASPRTICGKALKQVRLSATPIRGPAPSRLPPAGTYPPSSPSGVSSPANSTAGAATPCYAASPTTTATPAATG